MNPVRPDKICVVVPNWNGASSLPACLDSLLTQTTPADIIVVDNNSTDSSLKLLADHYLQVETRRLSTNTGFAGGVNAGIRRAMKNGATYVALFNNDAVADNNWLTSLVEVLNKHKGAGLATGRLLNSVGSHLDSTGESYTTWGLPFPRGRGERDIDRYDSDKWVFGASGGASIYRIKMLQKIGLFDEDFFAYYEDVDISFRAQLAGWKVIYEPSAKAYHKIGAASGSIKGFTTYQTMKNLPWLFWKNVPLKLIPKMLPRFTLTYIAFFASAIRRHQGWPAFKGLTRSLLLMPKKLWQRHAIQKNRKVTAEYIDSILIHDLPPNAYKLRALRNTWHKLTLKDSR